MPLVVREVADLQLIHQFVNAIVDFIFRQSQWFQDNADIFNHGQLFEHRWFLGQIGNAA